MLFVELELYVIYSILPNNNVDKQTFSVAKSVRWLASLMINLHKKLCFIWMYGNILDVEKRQ